MIVDVTAVLQKALKQLGTDNERLDRQIKALEAAVNGGTSWTSVVGEPIRRRRRPKMSAEARRAVGRRMQAYWARRKGAKRKQTGKSAKPARN
jgi:cell division septum initiation protein DivIVA